MDDLSKELKIILKEETIKIELTESSIDKIDDIINKNITKLDTNITNEVYIDDLDDVVTLLHQTNTKIDFVTFVILPIVLFVSIGWILLKRFM